MKLIAHRGLFQGPNHQKENSPEQIELALSRGYDCEIDLWVVGHDLFLGHDSPTYPIKPEYLNDNRFWIHAKNLDALYWLSNTSGLNYFWHEADQYAMTSDRHIWTLKQHDCTDRTVVMVVDQPDPSLLKSGCYAICSDYSDMLREAEN